MAKRGPKKGTRWAWARSEWDYYERFWSKVDRSGSCWEWLAAKHKEGYGALAMNGKMLRAHRVSYEWLVGEIPEGLVTDHLCRNPSCVNPAHLELVTNEENLRRGNTRGPKKKPDTSPGFRKLPPGPLADLARSGVFKKL